MGFAQCNFFDCMKIVPIAVYTSAGTDRTSEVIDTKGASAVRIIVTHAVIATGSVMNLTLQHSDAASNETTLTTGADVATSSFTVADDADNQVKYIDFCPSKRYYQLTFNKDGTNAAAESAIALLRMKNRPITHAAGTSTIGDGAAAVTGETIGMAVSGTA